MTYARLFASCEEELLAVGEEAEALSFVFRELKKLSLTDFVLLLRQEVSDEDALLIRSIVNQLLAHRPAQYIIGTATFCGLDLAVDERVLIPRPETEELVALILEENPATSLRVLDIGTGSGAIALTLAKARPDWEIHAVDISPDALSLAQDNAARHGLAVSFSLSDVCQSVVGSFDIIVSNPPYIAWEDRAEVGQNVLLSEPHLALFAEEGGLLIYRKIAEEAKGKLRPKGKIYLEMGYKQGEALTALFSRHYPEKRIRVMRDFYGKERKVVVDEYS